MGLIIPKNNADKRTLDETLRVYYEANDWVSNQELIDKLSKSLIELGIENQEKEPQSYTKKTQVPAYYGFIEWQDPVNSQSPRRITDIGKKFYEARIKNDKDLIIKILIESLKTNTFGRNVLGCDSDSDLEAPNIFIKSSLILDGLSNIEYSFILGRMELNKVEFYDALFEVVSKRKIGINIEPESNAKKWNDPKPITALKNWGFFIENNKIDPEIIKKYYRELLSLRIKNTEPVRFVSKEYSICGESNTYCENSPYRSYITALRTKPFLLLAGISGTGKSQKVQELAFMTCPPKLRDEGSTTPGNYCLIEVKPNWHDSSDLLGYYSALSGKYELTDFIRFAYKAIQNPDTPFFLCLDEMNLAPVEQYFAEYLSVLETRKRVGDDIETEPLLTKEKFSNCELQKYTATDGDGVITKDGKGFNMAELYSESDRKIIEYLKVKGLYLPSNLFVIGTVNMDDTTHQFSRKVIDRAFTIEMNGGKMVNMFSDESKALLEYKDKPMELGAFKSEFVRANEVLDDDRFMKYAGTIKEQIPLLLGDSDGKADEDSVNGILNNTPFRVSYRVQNELVLYLSVLIENAGFPEDITALIHEATLAILLEKVLPRVQGEQKQLETKNGGNVLKDMKAFVENHFKPIADNGDETQTDSLYSKVLCKLDEMDKKLDNYYTNFF